MPSLLNLLLLTAPLASALPPQKSGWFSGQNEHTPTQMVDSKTLQDHVNATRIMDHLAAFEEFAYAHPEGNRLAGGKAHNQTLQYIMKQLSRFPSYYDLEVQLFHKRARISSSATLYIHGEKVDISGISRTNRAPELIQGEILPAMGWGCTKEEFPDRAANNLVFIGGVPELRPACSIETVLKNAAELGVAALIKGPFGPEPRHIMARSTEDSTCTFCERPREAEWDVNGIPMIEINSEASENLRGKVMAWAAELSPDMFGSIKIHERPWKDIYSYNVFATTRMGNANNTLMLGAHSDSVAAGPGINDNGSGSAALLELAIQLAKYQVNSRVRFAWWTAEEEGLLGSEHYVRETPKEELDQIRLYLNFDMIGSPNYILGAYDGDGSDFGSAGPAGSGEAKHLFHDYFKSQGFAFKGQEFSGRSDYGPFLQVGIPCGGVATGAEEFKTPQEAAMFGGLPGVRYDENYHLSGDTLDNVNPLALLVNTRAIAHAIGTYGASFKDFPPRKPTRKDWQLAE